MNFIQSLLRELICHVVLYVLLMPFGLPIWFELLIAAVHIVLHLLKKKKAP